MKHTAEEFISKAIFVHGHEYDYSKVNYINNKTKVCIICPIHGEFWQRPDNHLNGHKCTKCAPINSHNRIKLNCKNKFVEMAKKIHGDKYNYSKTKYIDSNTKVCIICPIHGEFWQAPSNHLNGCGCKKCGNNDSYTIEEFVRKAIKIHGDKYDYSKVNYVNNKTKICIICKEHGEFWQISTTHLDGHGCPKCGKERSFSSHRKSTKEFIDDANKIYNNKYDYSKVEYKNAYTKICIICPKHGEFYQKPNGHLNGHGCPKCGREISVSKALKSVNYIISNSIKVHGNKYDYSKMEYKGIHARVCIICPDHGEFWQTPNNHLKGHGCPLCSESHGEREIRKWLDNHNVIYEREKEFPGLTGINGGNLRFDFYLPNSNTCIEFDGLQHRKWIEGMMTEHDFNILLNHDERKNKFCKENGIRLIRIWEEDGKQKYHSINI